MCQGYVRDTGAETAAAAAKARPVLAIGLDKVKASRGLNGWQNATRQVGHLRRPGMAAAAKTEHDIAGEMDEGPPRKRAKAGERGGSDICQHGRQCH